MLGMGYVILLWHSLSLPYNYRGYQFESDNGFSLKTKISLGKNNTEIFNNDIDKTEI